MTLSAQAPSDGVSIRLESASGDVTAPQPLVISAPNLTGTAVFIARASAAPGTVVIKAMLGTDTREATVTILAQPAQLTSLQLDNTTIDAGQTTHGTVRLANAAPVGGTTIRLSSSSSAVTVPREVIVSAGSTSATFLVESSEQINAAVTATITGTLDGVARIASVRVSPRPLSTFFKWSAAEPVYMLGSSGTVSSPPATFQADALCGDNWVTVYISDPRWLIEFSMPAGQAIRPGSYPNAVVDIRNATSPSLYISGSSAGCSITRGTGSFTITDAVFNNGRVERFRATFSTSCGSGGWPAISGEISLQSPAPANTATMCLR